MVGHPVHTVRRRFALDFAGIEYDFFDLENDREFLNEAKQFYNHPTVPIV